jgi:hypothetical protein
MDIKRSSIRNIVERLHGEPARNLQVDMQPLHGGLEASVVELTAQFYDRLGRHRVTKLVAKRLAGLVAREGRRAIVCEREGCVMVVADRPR